MDYKRKRTSQIIIIAIITTTIDKAKTDEVKKKVENVQGECWNRWY
jgi:hypothetical protein